MSNAENSTWGPDLPEPGGPYIPNKYGHGDYTPSDNPDDTIRFFEEFFSQKLPFHFRSSDDFPPSTLGE